MSADQGVIDLQQKTISYTAVPYPLPDAWKKELIDHHKFRNGDNAHLMALEVRMRATIGQKVTRKYIPPVAKELK